MSSGNTTCNFTVTNSSYSGVAQSVTYNIVNSQSGGPTPGPNTGTVKVGYVIQSLSLSTSSIMIGESSVLTVTLSGAPTLDLPITIVANTAGKVTVSGCTVLANQTTCTTSAVATAAGTTTFTASATNWGSVTSSVLTITSGPSISGVASPNTLSRPATAYNPGPYPGQYWTTITATLSSAATTNVTVTFTATDTNDGTGTATLMNNTTNYSRVATCSISVGNNTCDVPYFADTSSTVNNINVPVSITAPGYTGTTVYVTVLKSSSS